MNRNIYIGDTLAMEVQQQEIYTLKYTDVIYVFT